MTGFDASNAFMSVHHTTLDKLVETSFEDERDRALMKQIFRGAQISLCANADEPRVEIVTSCGFLQGDVSGPSLFNDVYSEQIAKWELCCQEEDRDAEYLHAKFFFTGDIHDMHPEALQRLSQPVEKCKLMRKQQRRSTTLTCS